MFSNEYPQYTPHTHSSKRYLVSDDTIFPNDSRESKTLKILSIRNTLESEGHKSLIQQGWEFHEHFSKSIPFDDGFFQYKPVFENGEYSPKNPSEKPVVIVKRAK